MQAGPKEVLEFLQHIFTVKQSFSYGSFNTYRSALSLILPFEVGKDPQIRRFLKGIFRLRPPQRKYHSTWDPAILLKHFERLPPNEELTLQTLSGKLATLLVLITAQRLQTLARIRVEKIHITAEAIQIFVEDHLKTTSPKGFQPCLIIPFFKENTSLCAASVLLHYIERTSPFRSHTQDFLFLTTRKPHLTASTQTISKWVKRTLSDAGIDTRIFSGYSAKHAGASAACRNGILLSTIRRTAGWSETSQVFAKYYNCTLRSPSAYAKAILQLK